MKIIPQFQKSYKLQVVNTVFLTDGDGQGMNQVYYTNTNGSKNCGRFDTTFVEELDKTPNFRNMKKFVIVDPVTKHQEYTDSIYSYQLTSHYIKQLKIRTGCNIVGFYVLSGREFTRAAYQFYPTVSDITNLRNKFRKEKYQIVTSAGYDEYYLLRSEGLDTDEDVEFEVKENATTRGLVSAFSKYAGNRLSNRVVLNRFVGLIA